MRLAIVNTVMSLVSLVVLQLSSFVVGTSSVQDTSSMPAMTVRLASAAPAIAIAALIVGWVAHAKGKPGVIKACIVVPWIYLIVLLLLLRG